jgi:hypothetical protein
MATPSRFISGSRIIRRIKEAEAYYSPVSPDYPFMPKLPLPSPKENAVNKIAEAILDFVGKVPKPEEHKSPTPSQRARTVANAAAAKAALAAGTLALPPGPLGWLTILPELVTVWKIQAQMVADIAAVYGKRSALSREQMLYCLFRHLAAQAVRDLVVRVGERFLIRRPALHVLQLIAQKIGMRISQRAITKGFTRWLPVVGALGVSAYSYYDTGQVAATAIELFEQDIEIEPKPNDAGEA